MTTVVGGLVYPGGPTPAATPATPVGTIAMFASSSPPTGWLVCDGAAVSRTVYAALFSVVGTTFGVGDGTTTFNLPDLVNSSPMGAGSTAALGVAAGALTSSHTHDAGSLRTESHTHGDGSLSVASHSHAAGTLTVDSHTHGVGSIAAGSHTHGSGSFSVASHTHALSDDGYAFISIDDPAGDVGMQVKTGLSSWTDTRQAYGTAGGQISTTWSSATPLGGATDAATADVAGTSSATIPSMSGATAGGTATISGSSELATADVTGSTGAAAANLEGDTASAAPSVLHPVVGVAFIIFVGE